ncbi:MAG: N-acetyltransferase [Spirochaetaceae bacterium]|nr:N-acetyltransferase [Spirochaetaceae bacterium]
MVGWCDVLPNSTVGFKHVGVLGMGLIREFRKKGIGSQLLKRTINHAKVYNGIEKVELEVFKSNINAISLYERSGFVFEGERVKSRKMDGVYDNLVLMGKELFS